MKVPFQQLNYTLASGGEMPTKVSLLPPSGPPIASLLAGARSR